MRNRGRETIEAMLFKPTTGGFVFRAPRPWVFGRARNYRVDAAQKAEIIAVMAPEKPAWHQAALVAALILGPVLWICGATAFVWAVSGHDEPTGRDVIAVMVLGVGPLPAALYFALAAGAQRQLAKLAPILARLAPSDEAITAADLRRGMARATSFRAMLTIILLFAASALLTAFTLGMDAAQHRLASLPAGLVALNFILSLVVIAVWAAMALRKAKGMEEGARG
jgi:hypothetical protein